LGDRLTDYLHIAMHFGQNLDVGMTLQRKPVMRQTILCMLSVILLAGCGQLGTLAAPSGDGLDGTGHTPTADSRTAPVPSSTQESAAVPILEIAVLEQVARATCPSRAILKIEQQDTTFNCWCAPAAGHSTSISIERFADPASAQLAFGDGAGEHTPQDFHGYPAALWDYPYPDPPQATDRFWLWQAERWVFTVHSFDDTHSMTAPQVDEVSEALYQASVQLGLVSDSK
jgi:hypothetical protein